MAKKACAWQRLTREGFFASRDEAERWILSGKVRCGGQPVRSGGEMLPLETPLAVLDLDKQFVSRGGHKLAGALDDFSLDVRGRVCIDAGASTGGFTDCLTQRGAARVYAVDVGFGQLAGSLRQNPAVVNLERMNIGDERLLSLEPAPEIATVDLSYLSLVRAVPQFARVMRGNGVLVCLVKPLFEIDDAAARRSGEIDERQYLPLLESLYASLTGEGYAVQNVTNSPILGSNGTHEFFLLVSLRGEGLTADAFRPLAAQAVSRVASRGA